MVICDSCFNDLELVTFIKANSTTLGNCEYCHKQQSSLLNLDEIADFLSEFFSIFKSDEKGVSLDELISNDWRLFSDNSEQLLKDILEVLKIQLNSKDKVAYIDEIIESTSYWEVLRDDLKWSRRFLTDVETIRELGWDGFFNKQVELNQELFRARIHRASDEAAYDISLMGCPTRDYATSGRANPQGIPYLYLSELCETTFYEIRAAYLDEVSVGKFKVKEGEKVVLVDFTEEVSAFINIDNIIDLTKSMVLKKKISLDLSKPLRRYDSELEYIPTQFICEFIRYITNVDGIIFNSSLHIGGRNVVLFAETKMECFEVNKYKICHVNIEAEKV